MGRGIGNIGGIITCIRVRIERTGRVVGIFPHVGRTMILMRIISSRSHPPVALGLTIGSGGEVGAGVDVDIGMGVGVRMCNISGRFLRPFGLVNIAVSLHAWGVVVHVFAARLRVDRRHRCTVSCRRIGLGDRIRMISNGA